MQKFISWKNWKQFGILFPLSLSLFIYYLFIYALSYLICVPTQGGGRGGGFPYLRGGVLSFDFPSWRFQFSFLCQTRYANIGRAPTATAMQTFPAAAAAFTVTVTITVIWQRYRYHCRPQM